MPASGGDAAKLGNQYEGIWAVDVVVKILDREVEWIVPEPWDDPEGIEFFTMTVHGRREFHSVKRQRSKGEWSPTELSRPDLKTGRSILGDLIRRFDPPGLNAALFVSGTGATKIKLLEEDGKRCRSMDDLVRMESRKADFDVLVSNLKRSREDIFEFLKQFRAVLIDATELRQRVDAQIDRLLNRIDGTVVEPEVVRLMLAEFVVNNHGNRLGRDNFIKVLREAGYSLADWHLRSDIYTRLCDGNSDFCRKIDADLISERFIERPSFESTLAVLQQKDGPKFIVIEGSAGVGKSCFVSALVARLASESVPVLAARIDDATGLVSTRDFGFKLHNVLKSPAAILAGVANGRRCVLVMDQLDAVSEFSGRDSRLRDLFERLREDAEQFPEMRVLLGCRTVDLESDYRLRRITADKNRHQRVKVERLTEDEVRQCLSHASVADDALTPSMTDILRTPIYLRVFFETLPDNGPAFRSSIDLFDRCWDLRRRQVLDRLQREPKWTETIDRLIGELRATRSLVADEGIFDDGNLTDDARAMSSCHVFESCDRRYRFFHEAFYDYCSIRRLGLKREPKSTLFDSMLANTDQDLNVRAQLRQVFQYNREREFETYLADLQAVLTDDRVRFHLKTMLIRWLGALDSPKPAEWKVLDQFRNDSDFGGRLRMAMRPNLAWFDVLDSNGVLAKWLNSDIEEDINTTVWLMTEPNALKQRSPRIAELIEPFYGRSDFWNQKVVAFFSWGEIHHSRRMFDLFLRAIDDGLIVAQRDAQHGRDLWSMLYQVGDAAPELCVEAIGHWIDAVDQRFDPTGHDIVFDRLDSNSTGEMIVQKVATNAPRAFYEHVSRRVISLVERHTDVALHDGRRMERVFGWSSNYSFGVAGQLCEGLSTSLEWMARNEFQTVAEDLERFAESDIETLIRLALSVWSAIPERFAVRGIEYLLQHPERLTLGYGSWSGDGTGYAAVARTAIATFGPFCDNELFQRLENTILTLVVRDGAGDWSQLYRYLLLLSLDQARLSDASRLMLDGLRGQFPEFNTKIAQRDESDIGRVLSPIDNDTAKGLTDDEWIATIQRFNFDQDHQDARHDYVEAIELSRQLQDIVRHDRHRFANLALRMPTDIRPHYFEALLNGLSARWANLSPEERAIDDAEIKSLPLSVWTDVIRRLHGLDRRPCGNAICGAIERLADSELPEELLDVVSWYAINDPDPTEELWNKETASGAKYYGGQPGDHGINTNRGRAAHAIYALLNANFSRMSRLDAALKSLVNDRSVAVRCITMSCLFPVLNHDRDEAVRLFRQLTEDEPLTWATLYWERFLHYACHSHYAALRSLLVRAARSDVDEVATAAARRMTLGAFNHLAEFPVDVSELLRENVAARVGVADVLSANVTDDVMGAFCRVTLLPLFHDPAEEVRQEAATCFRKMDGSQLQQHSELLDKFVTSPAFGLERNPLLDALDACQGLLPQSTLTVLETYLDQATVETSHVSRASAMDSSHVSKLTFRIYEQSPNTASRNRCLDLIDRMERLWFYDVTAQLSQVDS